MNTKTLLLVLVAFVAYRHFARRPATIAVGEPSLTPSVETSWDWTFPSDYEDQGIEDVIP